MAILVTHYSKECHMLRACMECWLAHRSKTSPRRQVFFFEQKRLLSLVSGPVPKLPSCRFLSGRATGTSSLGGPGLRASPAAGESGRKQDRGPIQSVQPGGGGAQHFAHGEFGEGARMGRRYGAEGGGADVKQRLLVPGQPSFMT